MTATEATRNARRNLAKESAIMAKRQKQWAREKRIELLLWLGGQCRECNATEDLEFDCIIPQGDLHHKLDMSARMSFYRRQYQEGNLQILCRDCNAKKSVQDLELAPF